MVVPEMHGTYEGLSVVLRNFPCLVDSSNKKRKYRYSAFGNEFLTELTEHQLGTFEKLSALLAAGDTKTVKVQLRDLGAIEVQLAARTARPARQFYSDLADALIVAFDSERIKP